MYQTKLIKILEEKYKDDNLFRLKFISSFVIKLLNKSSVNLVEIAYVYDNSLTYFITV